MRARVGVGLLPLGRVVIRVAIFTPGTEFLDKFARA